MPALTCRKTDWAFTVRVPAPAPNALRVGGSAWPAGIIKCAGSLGAILRSSLAIAALAGVARAADVINLGTDRELFVDHYLIGALNGVRLKLNEPRREGVALAFDRPWEGAFSAYITVIKDGDRYRMYYRGLPEVGKGYVHKQVTCYAESPDGITWTKPNLRLFEILGKRENNVILPNTDWFNECFTPFLDTRPGVADEERFKAFARSSKGGLVPFVSADGLRWRTLADHAVITEGNFDSQNVSFWSEREQCYVCYFRTTRKIDGTVFRWISRTTSADFLTWAKPAQMEFGDTPPEQLYTSATHPYFRAPQIYIAMPKRFFPAKAALPPGQAKNLVANPGYRVASSDAVFMTTRGGYHFERTFLEAFIRPGPDPEDWVARDNMPALGVVPATERVMWLYRLSHYAQPTSQVTRYSLRTDGFVSVNASYAGGELITKPLQFTGNKLEMNFATSAAGSIRVELQTPEGKAIASRTLDECPEIMGDEIARIVAWRTGTGLAAWTGQPVRLRFVMRDADLYSIRFVP